MMLRKIVLAAALALAAACVAPRVAPTEGRLQLIDLTDDFAEIWEQTASLDDASRAAAFKAQFAKLLPGFYGHERMGLPGPERYDAHLLKALRKYPEQRAGIEEVSRNFSAMLAPAQLSFEAAFGPMTGYPPIYLVNSLNEFDGGTRELPEGVRLLFGADMIHKSYQGIRVQPFFHHELFHLFHSRTFPECEPIWCALWTEGLATHVSVVLNPGATDAELLLNWPEPIRPAVERDRRHAICTTLAKLESTAPGDYRAMFSNARLDARLPPRFGYYIGYLVAAQAGRTRSVQDLARLGPDEVRPLVEQTLRELAACPAVLPAQ